MNQLYPGDPGVGERDLISLAWIDTANALRSALRYVAAEMHGEEFADKVLEAAGDDLWPRAEALDMVARDDPAAQADLIAAFEQDAESIREFTR